jgi:hypothetical protein
MKVIDNGLHYAFAIVGVVNGKVFRVSQLLGLKPKDPGKNRVKRSNVEISGLAITQNSLNPLFHLAGCLIGKGEGQDIERIHLVCGHQMYDTGSKDFGLTTSCTGHDQHWTIVMKYRLALSFV